ncbi:deoxyguanosinetriphosphate triphosphohydrolase [Hornefia butyriciproducens]|uniref:deoxyguanosinetriphosphate triphosphohydrolase n=1 Tax=Hornefia butyriciproducens TaxID=2652293 RepID=UPI003F8C0D88
MRKREELEEKELRELSLFASKAAVSRGRAEEEEPCPFRTCFQRDRDRIIHSKAFRRLMHKTQVFLSPEGDHYRTRLTHTLEVTQVARTIARTLNLNEDLTEAIALGHDLGHTPFGHNGESVLNSICPGGFRHNEQSLRVVDVLEYHNGRRGMNLTFEVRNGILNHTGNLKAKTLEGQIVGISDRIAYINHDIDDAIRSGVIRQKDLPSGPIELFGERHGDRIANMIENVVMNSDGKNEIAMDREHAEQLNVLRDFMFKNVYKSRSVKKEEDLAKVEVVLTSLYNYFLSHPEKMPDDLRELGKDEGTEIAVKDYVAGMTDRYAVSLYTDIFVPDMTYGYRK